MASPIASIRVKLSIKRRSGYGQSTALSLGVYHGLSGEWAGTAIESPEKWLVCSRMDLSQSWMVPEDDLKKVTISIAAGDNKRKITVSSKGEGLDVPQLSQDSAVIFLVKTSRKEQFVLIKGVHVALNRDFFPFVRSPGPAGFQITQVFSRVSSTTLVPCENCGSREQETSMCTGCKHVAYCGTVCQAAHWKRSHFNECTRTVKTQKNCDLKL